MITISGNCTPKVSIDIDFDENPNGLPVVWLKTGPRGVDAPLNKEAVSELIKVLIDHLIKM